MTSSLDSLDHSVRVKTGAGWRSHSRVRLLISVGQNYHEGAKLQAVVAWLNRNPTVRDVHVSVNGFLQRHNLIAAGLPADEAGAQALASETAWIERNAGILAEIKTAGWFMTRWRDWLDRPDFAARLTALANYAAEQEAKNAARAARGLSPLVTLDDVIDQDATGFASRKVDRNADPIRYERLAAHSRDYVREELAVFAMQAEELPAAEVYPGSNLAAAAYLAGRADLPEPLRPLATREFTRIDFARIEVAPAPPHPQRTLRIA